MSDYRVAWSPTNYYPTESGVAASGGHFIAQKFKSGCEARAAARKMNTESLGSIGHYYVIY